jgi:hypothetical protein
MAKSFLTDIQLNKNQLLGAKIEVLASAPSSPQEGQIYYNSTDETLYIRQSGDWLDCGAQGLSNGDKGDITVASLGDSLTINNDAVTYAKIQNIAADNVLLGNNTGAGGIVDELTATEVRTLLNVEDGATADQTAGEIKTAYESNSNTNALTDALLSKLNGIETGADVTDATNVDAAGAVMNSDTSTASMSFVIDEDTMTSNSATKVPTQQSVRAYVDAAITGGTFYKGGYNAATNTPDLDSTPIATLAGDMYTVTAAGTFFTTPVQVGDVLICEAASATTEAEWTIVNKNIPDIVSATESDEGLIEIATQGEVTTGTDDTRAITPLKLKTHLGETGSLNVALRYTTTIGNGSSTTLTVTHNIGRQFVTAQVFETSSPYAQVECDIECDSTTQASFTFNTAPTSNQYTVVITG